MNNVNPAYAQPIRPHTAQVLMFLAGIMAGAAVLFLVGGSQPAYIPAYVILATTGSLLIWCISGAIRDEPPWYSPHVFVLVFLLLIEVLATLPVIYFQIPSEVYHGPISPEQMFYATLVGLIGVIFYLIGWRIGPKRATCSVTLESLIAETPASRGLLPIMTVLLFGLSSMAWIYMFGTGGGMSEHLANQGGGRREIAQESGGAILHLSRFGFAASLMFFARYGIKNPLALAMLGLYLMFLLVFGSRGLVVAYLAGILVVYRIRFRTNIPVWMWAGGLLAGVFVATFGAAFRASQGDFGEAWGSFTATISTLEGAVLLVLGHMTFIIQRAELITYLQNTGDYQYGLTLLSIFKVIPGVIWPGVRDLPSGNIFYLEALRPNLVGKVSLTSVFFTEMFVNFAWFGVAAGGFVFGWCMRWLHSRLLVHPARAFQIAPVVVVAILGFGMLGIIKSGVQQLAALFYYLLPVFSIYFINLVMNVRTSSPIGMAERSQQKLLR